jgi:hypothetical protein
MDVTGEFVEYPAFSSAARNSWNFGPFKDRRPFVIV